MGMKMVMLEEGFLELSLDEYEAKYPGSLEKVVLATIYKEGGNKIDNDPADPGGTTKYGIAARYHPTENIAKLTLERAIRLIIEKSVGVNKLGELPFAVVMILIDSAMIPGPSFAPRSLQRAVGFSEKDVDGKIGPKTIANIYRDWETDRKSKRLNSSHSRASRMPSSA